jgi:hypothetical protein
MTNIAKCPAHIAADQAIAAATERLANGRQLYQQANVAHAAAIAAKNQLLASSTAGDGVTAEQIRTVEDAARNTESCLGFAKAALDGAQDAHAKAIDTLRSLEQVWFKARAKELSNQHEALVRQADDFMAQAKETLRAADAFREEFHQLAQEAAASPAAPHVRAAGAGPLVPTPGRSAVLRISIDSPNSFGSNWTHGNFSSALGYGAIPKMHRDSGV